jgi:hypothetical protein
MAKARNYRAEYERRVARASSLGLTRSQARGHAKPGEVPARSTSNIKPDAKLEAALKALRYSGNQGLAARSAGVSTERFRRFLAEGGLARRNGRAWELIDNRLREVRIVSSGRSQQVRVAGFDPASVIGRHTEAVRAFLETNDISKLAPFEGVVIRDAKGKRHLLETRPNTLYRLAAAGSEGFEQIYRLIN